MKDRKHLNEHVTNTVGECFKEVLNYMDSKRDRDTVIAMIERLTSVKFVARKLLNVQNKGAVQGIHLRKIYVHLEAYEKHHKLLGTT